MEINHNAIPKSICELVYQVKFRDQRTGSIWYGKMIRLYLSITDGLDELTLCTDPNDVGFWYGIAHESHHDHALKRKTIDELLIICINAAAEVVIDNDVDVSPDRFLLNCLEEIQGVDALREREQELEQEPSRYYCKWCDRNEVEEKGRVCDSQSCQEQEKEEQHFQADL